MMLTLVDLCGSCGAMALHELPIAKLPLLKSGE